MIRILGTVLALALAAGGLPAVAQSLYSPVITVNSDAITRYEIDQRARLLRALNTLGDLNRQAREALVDDRLRMQAARTVGVEPTESEIDEEMAAFVDRGGLDDAAFAELLTSQGVDMETFREFSRIRVLWREVIRIRFAGSAQISEEEVDRAMSLTAGRGGLRVLLTELVLPVPDPSQRDATYALADEFSRTLTTQDEFERAARRYSAAPSRAESGRLDWIDLSRLPRNLGEVLVGMSPGQVSPPLELQNSIVLFRLRGLSEAPSTNQREAAVEYATVQLAGTGDATRSRAATLAARADTCIDLQALAGAEDGAVFSQESLPPASVPPRLLAELDRLDPGEVSTRLTSVNGRDTLVVMLCGRSAVIETDESRDQIANRMRQQRLESLAASFLAELRAAAEITGL